MLSVAGVRMGCSKRARWRAASRVAEPHISTCSHGYATQSSMYVEVPPGHPEELARCVGATTETSVPCAQVLLVIEEGRWYGMRPPVLTALYSSPLVSLCVRSLDLSDPHSRTGAGAKASNSALLVEGHLTRC